MIERTTVRLPEELLDRARRRAAAEGRTLTSLIEEGLREIISQRKTPGVRVLPPVSMATGGLLPGVDLKDTAAIEEGDDLAYIAQAKRRK
jgi:hypothetical protein